MQIGASQSRRRSYKNPASFVREICIELDDDEESDDDFYFRPGDVVSGKVEVELTETLRFKSLSISFLGLEENSLSKVNSVNKKQEFGYCNELR